jgi:hypothetical protein
MITAKGADIFRDDHIRSQSYFIIERKAHRGLAVMAARAIWKGSISFGLVNIPGQVFSATQKGRVEIHDENVVICKDCSRICFNMEVWLSVPAI